MLPMFTVASGSRLSARIAVGQLLLILLIGADLAHAQFKILGLLDTSAPAGLDTQSPLVAIGSFAAPETGGEGRSLAGDLVARNSTASEQNSTELPLEPDTDNGIIKVRIMDEQRQLKAGIPGLENELHLPDATGIAVLLDKQSRQYAKAYKPQIRKFAYAEERSFHKAGKNTYAQTDEAVAADKRRHEQKLKKITRYRNKFQTRCRCERISNCPRIQITIHRCAQDYFMCCF